MTQRARRSLEEWDDPDYEQDNTPIIFGSEYQTLSWNEEEVTIRDLWYRYLDGRIILQPDFQRNYVWDSTKASRYIESLIIRFPTPPVFLAEEEDGSHTVIDGHQRLETLFRYLQPLLQGPSRAAGIEHHRYTVVSPLSLRDLNVIPDLNGKNVTALPIPDREKLWNTNIKTIKLPKSVAPALKYELFARLNQGSMSLNSQELRNCLYRGRYNDLIARLSEDRAFLRLWNRNAPDKRMRHRELVLRFFALLHRRDRYRIPFREFLNDEMFENLNPSPEEQRRFQRELEIAMKWVERIFSNQVFRIFRIGDELNPAGRWVQRRYDLLYEIQVVGFGHFREALDRVWDNLNPAEQENFRVLLRHRLVDTMTNSQFIDAINEGTTRPTNVALRFNLWNQALNSIVQNPDLAIQEGGAIQERFGQNNICAECSNQLAFDDAVWANSPGDRRLVHRFCQIPRR